MKKALVDRLILNFSKTQGKLEILTIYQVLSSLPSLLLGLFPNMSSKFSQILNGKSVYYNDIKNSSILFIVENFL